MSEQQRVVTRAPGKEPVKVACAQCLRETTHNVLALVEVHTSVDDSYEADSTYQIVICRGCDNVSFRLIETSSDDLDANERGEAYRIERVQVFPPLVAGRAPLQGLHLLPYPLNLIYAETREALASNQSILAGAGIRVLIEAVCKEKGAAGGSLLERIDALAAMGVLTQSGADILHMLRGLGNTAAHEARPFSREKLATAFDVVEHLLQGVYLLPKKAASLADSAR